MAKPSTREWTMIGFLAVVAVVGYYYGRPDAGGEVGGADAAKFGTLGEPPVVLLARLELNQESYDQKARNLFKYYVPPPPQRKAPPPRKIVAPPSTMSKPVVRKPPPPSQPGPPRAAQPPRMSFQYIGLLGPKELPVAVFEQNGQIMVHRIDEVIQDEFILKEFKHEAVVMGYTDERFKDQTTELQQKKGR